MPVNRQTGAYAAYEAGALELLKRLKPDDPFKSDALIYQRRLSKNIHEARLHGDTDALKGERSEIIARLDELARSAWNIPFRVLCNPFESIEDIADSIVYVSDPLCLAKLEAESPAHFILRNAFKARSYGHYTEALRLCEDAVQCAAEHGDAAEIALTYLYHAEAQARMGQLEAGIELAERATRIFKIEGNRYNTMVAQLVLARLQSSHSLTSARVKYLEALQLCRKLEEEASETASNKQVLFCRQITEEIEQVLENIDETIEDRYIREFVSHPSPTVESKVNPDIAPSEGLHSGMIDCITTGELMVRGCKYHVYPLDKTQKIRPDFKAGAIHFAVPVPMSGWLDPSSERGDYILVRLETQPAQEGLGVLWTGDEWVAGQFERDVTGRIRFAPQVHRIIGDSGLVTDYIGYVIALLKAKTPFEPMLFQNEKYDFTVGILQNNLSGYTTEAVRLTGMGRADLLPAMLEPVRLPPGVDATKIDVTIRAQDMEVSPHWTQRMHFFSEGDSGLVEFGLVPRESGHKQIEVDFYYQRHWLTHIRLGTKVVSLDE